MKKLPIFLTLVLIGLWAYTSWYWYVCNIKGLCDIHQVSTQGENNTNLLGYDDVTGQMVDNITEDSDLEISGTGEVYHSPKLSAGDVLRDNPRPVVKKEEEQERVEEAKEDEADITITVLTGSTDTRDEAEETLEDRDIGPGNEQQTSREDGNSICEAPLEGPIAVGSNNDTIEVEKLEAFLIARGARVSIDGTYDRNDAEEIKKFQLEYKNEILDPWGIDTPTGYVGTTTIKKINELSCQ